MLFSRLLIEEVRKAMNDPKQQLGTSDIGILIFIIVAGWFLLFQSGLIY